MIFVDTPESAALRHDFDSRAHDSVFDDTVEIWYDMTQKIQCESKIQYFMTHWFCYNSI